MICWILHFSNSHSFCRKGSNSNKLREFPKFCKNKCVPFLNDQIDVSERNVLDFGLGGEQSDHRRCEFLVQLLDEVGVFDLKTNCMLIRLNLLLVALKRPSPA